MLEPSKLCCKVVEDMSKPSGPFRNSYRFLCDPCEVYVVRTGDFHEELVFVGSANLGDSDLGVARSQLQLQLGPAERY